MSKDVFQCPACGWTIARSHYPNMTTPHGSLRATWRIVRRINCIQLKGMILIRNISSI
ncbi:MAG: hypothetical protein ACFFBD_09370 [Candidatus Hodarchaeota archaeon]